MIINILHILEATNKLISIEKSNEMTAIPKLLELLSIKGTVVAIDVIGCQTNIASAIIAKQADYILAVKGNQPQLLENIKDEFRSGQVIQTCINETLDHGRIETHKCSVINDFRFIEKTNHWTRLNALR